MILDLFLIAGLSYLIGSLPVAWVVTRLAVGRDIRTMGSGNIGVMNVALQVARWAGLLVFGGEIAKALAVVWLARMFGMADWQTGIAVAAAVFGTRWSFLMGFKGGRGSTTGAAGLLILSWQSLAAALALWLALRAAIRSSFLATRIVLYTLPLVVGFITRSWAFGFMAGIMSVVYLTSHNQETDDHLLIKERWPNFWAFLFGPPRGQSVQRRRAQPEHKGPADRPPA